MTSHGNIDLGQHWLRFVAWRHQAITWTNVDFWLGRFSGIPLGAISHWVTKLLYYIMSLKIILLEILPHIPGANELTHRGRVTHICASKLTIIDSDNGLSSDRRQAIIWINVGILLIGPSGTIFSEISIENHTFSFKKMHLKMSSAEFWKMAAILSWRQCVKWWTMVLRNAFSLEMISLP